MSEKTVNSPAIIIGVICLILLILFAAWLTFFIITMGHEHRIVSSVANLKLIGLGLRQYAIDSENFLPVEPGAKGFKKLMDMQIMTDYEIFISLRDGKAVKGNAGSFTEKNTSYVYIGAGLQEGKYQDEDKIPVAFEKPRFAKRSISILYMDGHVSGFSDVNAKTCVDVVEFCRAKYNPVDPVWHILLANARFIDKTSRIK